MPISIDPKATWQYTLKGDAPGNYLEFRFATASQWRKLTKVLNPFSVSDDVKSAKPVDEIVDSYAAGIKALLVGWHLVADGKPIPYNPEALEDVMSIADICELRDTLMVEMAIKEDTIKKYVPQLPIGGVNSAQTAATGSPAES